MAPMGFDGFLCSVWCFGRRFDVSIMNKEILYSNISIFFEWKSNNPFIIKIVIFGKQVSSQVFIIYTFGDFIVFFLKIDYNLDVIYRKIKFQLSSYLQTESLIISCYSRCWKKNYLLTIGLVSHLLAIRDYMTFLYLQSFKPLWDHPWNKDIIERHLRSTLYIKKDINETFKEYIEFSVTNPCSFSSIVLRTPRLIQLFFRE